MNNRMLSCAFAVCLSGAFAVASGLARAEQSQGAEPFHYVLEAFPVSQTDLTEDQEDLLTLAADELDTLISAGKKKCLRVVGHAATWRDISEETYCKRSTERAKSAAAFLKALFESGSSRSVAHLTEDQVGLGRTNACTGSAKTTCEPDPNADVTIVWGGRSDKEPQVDNMVDSTSQEAQDNRARNRRIEITFLDPPDDVVPPPRSCKPLSKAQANQFTRTVSGLEPKRFEPAQALYAFIKDGHNSPVCKAVRKGLKRADPETRFIGGAACVLMERYAEAIKQELGGEDPHHLHGALMGAAYAMVDGPDHRDRSTMPLGKAFRNSVKTGHADRQSYRDGFNVGYRQTRIQLQAFQKAAQSSGDEAAVEAMDRIYGQVHCKPGGQAIVVKHVYDTLLRQAQEGSGQVWRRANRFLAAAGRCGFDYPKVAFHHCGPLPR